MRPRAYRWQSCRCGAGWRYRRWSPSPPPPRRWPGGPDGPGRTPRPACPFNLLYSDVSDQALRELLARDPAAGWNAFIDEHTPLLLALIEQAGMTRRDEAMELYLKVCERLSADDCARLRRRDPAVGSLQAWLATVTRHVLVDWVRSKRGRRRLFRSVKALSTSD